MIKKLQELNIIAHVCAQWYELGIRLLDEGHQQAYLKNIACGDKKKMHYRKMFEYWLQVHVKVT